MERTNEMTDVDGKRIQEKPDIIDKKRVVQEKTE